MQRLLNSSGFVQPIPAAAPLAVERPGSVGSTRAHDRGRSTFNSSAAVALAIFIGAAARVLPPLLAGPIQRELNWSDSEITWPIVISIAVSALAAPLAAISLECVGIRTLLFANFVLLTASLALSSLATSLWHLLFLWGVGIGLSGSLSASVLSAVVGLRNHAAHCGTSFGLFTSVQFLGSAAGLLLASRATDCLGWRVVVNGGATATLGTAFAIALALHGSSPRAAPTKEVVARIECPGASVRKSQFWIFAAIFFICGASTNGLIDGRLSMLCISNGLGLASGADVLAIIALSGVIGSAASGLLADRYPARMLLASYFALRALALFWLPFTNFSFVGLARFGAFYGLDAALTFPALAKLLSGNCDRHNIGMVMSCMTAAHVAGAATMSALVGFIGLANYAISLAVVGLMCLLAVGLVRISAR